MLHYANINNRTEKTNLVMPRKSRIAHVFIAFFHRHFPRSLQRKKENVLCMYMQLKVQTICNLSFGFAFFSLSTHISVDRRSKNQLPERHAGSQNKEEEKKKISL